MNDAFLLLCVVLGAPESGVPDLLTHMGSSSFAVRERASHKAQQLSHRAVLQLSMASWAHDDVEVQRRCQQAVTAQQRLHYPLGRVPWLEGCSQVSLQTRDKYLYQVRPYGSPFGNRDNDWLDYRDATSLLLRDLFALGWSRAQVQSLVNELSRIEEDWKRRDQADHGEGVP